MIEIVTIEEAMQAIWFAEELSETLYDLVHDNHQKNGS